MDTPINHFSLEPKYWPHVDGTFGLSYWFDSQFYKPGGPVLVLCAGETAGAGRLPFLEKGIMYELEKSTGGIGVVLEHRYYGDSVPVDSFSTENLRFLTTEQAIADAAWFARHAHFEGLEDVDLRCNATPWIAYGGSYAGAFAAFLRVLHPDVFWGSISSSGVPVAIWDYWEYYEAVRRYGPADCVQTTLKLTDFVDRILIDDGNPQDIQQLKEAFALGNLTHDDDFANVISRGISSFQNLNWDPAVSDDSFYQYCNNITVDTEACPLMEPHRDSIRELLVVAGYEKEMDTMLNRTLNYIGWLNRTAVAPCINGNHTPNECFTSHNDAFYSRDDLTQAWRPWLYQVCTEWGFLLTGSSVPYDRKPLISRKVDLQYASIGCRRAFNLTKPANVTRINQYGAFQIHHPRLAFIDGEWDPWRRAGVHAPQAPERPSTTDEPYILIGNAVHHWDENGLFEDETTEDLPPDNVRKVKDDIADFVGEWLKGWDPDRASHGR